ncbi:MAG: cation-translocating P-type ATPase [Cyanobacteria bacterium]|nr:cation-translocating P-type ATPase [Cyanobacteriota bacterium]
MTKQLELHVANLDCDHDAATLRRGLQQVAGISDLQILPKAAKVRVTFDPSATTAPAIENHLRAIGFPPQLHRATATLPRPWRNAKVLTSAGSGVLLLIGWFSARSGAETFALALYLASTVSGAWYFGREAIEELIFEREIGIELLMLVAAAVAIVMGQAGEGAMLAFLYSISEAAEGYTEEKTRSAIRALMDLTPKTALVRRNGREETIPVEALQVGDLFIVKPGQSIATDGIVEAGDSSVNQAPVTGESVPVHKTQGQTVFAGTINEEGALEIRATKTSADNTVSRIIHMVEEAQEQKGHSQRFIERFGARYSPSVLLAGILLAIIPSLLTGNWVQWIERATVFVVSAAPCALVISIPITLVATLGTGARHGVLIKGGVYVEELAKVTVVALDKTGTLTRGEPEVTAVAPREGTSDEVLALAAAVERWSQHPLARAVVQHAQARGVSVSESTLFQSITGLGAVAMVGSRRVYVGSPELFIQRLAVSLDTLAAEISRLQESGNTVVLVGDDARVDGLIAIRDNLRENARAALERLRESGVTRIVMLTGDNARTARALAAEAGVDDVFADLKPEQKVEKVRELSTQFGHVAMVGDGVNDAPALAAATIGVAMGAAGTDVALETADVALMADDLERLAYALELARRNQRIVRQNLGLSTIVIAVLVIGALAGAFNLPIAVLGHEISEFVVIGSGLRMLRG